MSTVEPIVEFGKNADDNITANDYDISHSFVGLPSALPAQQGLVNGTMIQPGNQTENWINKNSQIGGETSFWNQTALDVYNPASPDPNFIDSGCGFIDSGATSKDIIRGQVSKAERIRVYCNRADLWRDAGVPQEVAAGENCRMVLYDNPSVDTQTDEAIVATDGSGDHLFWTKIEQLDYFFWTGAAWSNTGETNGPAFLGFNVGAPLNPSAINEPHKTSAGGLQGFNTFPVGHQIAASKFIGTRQTVVGGYKDAEGGYADLEVTLFVPDNASAQFHSWALAVEYTFVLS